LFGRDIGSQGAVALVGGSLAVGTFLATAVGTRLRIRRPTALQSSGLTITAGVAVLTAIFFTLPMVALLSLVASIFSGISKLAVDASIQERVPERLRASAFAHSETVLMIAWVVGGAVGIIPLNGRLGVSIMAAFAVAAAIRGTVAASRLHKERLHGRPDVAMEDNATRPDPAALETESIPTSPAPAGAATTLPPRPPGASSPATSRRPTSGPPAPNQPASDRPATAPGQPGPDRDGADAPKRGLFSRLGSRKRGTTHTPTGPAPHETAPDAPAPGRSDPAGIARPSTADKAGKAPAESPPRDDLAPPGFHIYRPTSASNGNGSNSHDESAP
jgi:hypothetical protein